MPTITEAHESMCFVALARCVRETAAELGAHISNRKSQALAKGFLLTVPGESDTTQREAIRNVLAENLRKFGSIIPPITVGDMTRAREYLAAGA
ncbi:hypothetical protein GCM10010401_06930 [Rarobacter faecitabidus]|uniref:Uncharacterized protein n=1 Tax=Rarobacter faecitabidus TaxID=13243 RepID=A0A542ZTG8_RARFA|nr:hypothetical protein [Rarobacter faecitabidus]TQL63559.1 hypothetical protein FB461_0019 [Rarobacter faecitabidus]